ncbi:two-component system, OmpR family, sensor histidine kinase VicK [Anaerosphaera aminiphila DSM 21120]|uniref:histidine kinase n=1 Tax=Anaerosphaera aminiphila DSM 21120 TaxID=1120995 RepID=A0A1M5SQ36_9FIRM|nr:two-component system, OmpR family, sensor histidine kinase VicK [Anaerosphaera aminiphila DSM 21120]
MFNSIKSKFITIYFLLMLICISIVGSLIINRLESQQIQNISDNINNNLNNMSGASAYMYNSNWKSQKFQFENTLDDWPLSQGEAIYAIVDSTDYPLILASSTSGASAGDKSALSSKSIEPDLVLKALSGEEGDKITTNKNTNQKEKHVAKPVLSSDGDVNGVLYMTADLSSVYKVIDYAKIVLSAATALALGITIVLGYILASSITVPIRDLTKKASKMAEGDFNQKFEVKSDDEIGKLGSMFNYLTEELDSTINQVNLEKSKLNTIFNYMAEGVIAVDREGFLLHANPIARNILSLDEEYFYKKQDLTKLNIFDINYYDDSTLEGETKVDIKDSFYKIKYAPYKKEDGKNSGLIVVLQDITKEHKLDLMRKEFVANVSHELKTPITTIKSYSETILESPLDKDDVHHFVSIINRENNRMGRLVSDLLQLSNLDYNSSNWNYEEIDTYFAINEILEVLSVLIEEKHQNIELDIPMDIKDIFADRHALEQVLMNIISNAIKYSDDSSTIKISATSNYFNVKIVVEDHGIGIPEEDIDRIFERFYRVEKSRSRAQGGTGLGLSIARELILSMNGDIKLESKLNEGTKVTLTFETA